MLQNQCYHNHVILWTHANPYIIGKTVQRLFSQNVHFGLATQFCTDAFKCVSYIDAYVSQVCGVHIQNGKVVEYHGTHQSSSF